MPDSGCWVMSASSGCRSLSTLRLCIVYFGVATVFLSGYGHLSSHYTSKSLLSNHSQYFPAWEFIHRPVEENTTSLPDATTSLPDATTKVVTEAEIETSTGKADDNSERHGRRKRDMEDGPDEPTTTSDVIPQSSEAPSPNPTNHSITEDAKMVLNIIPKSLQNGQEACRAFRDFIEELVKELKELDRETELAESIKDPYYNPEYCPSINHERFFVGAAVVGLLLTTVCLSMSMLCCKTTMDSYLNKCTDVTYHILCGVALIIGAGNTASFLRNMNIAVCSGTSLVMYKEFHEALLDFQIHYHKSNTTGSSIPIKFDLERAKNLTEINDALRPKYADYVGSFAGRSVDTTTAGRGGSPSTRKGRITNEVDGMSKRKRKFSWSKKVTRKTTSISAYSRYACQVHVGFFWKLAGVFTGTITAIFYIVAAVNIIRMETTVQPEQIYIAQDVASKTETTSPKEGYSKRTIIKTKHNNESNNNNNVKAKLDYSHYTLGNGKKSESWNKIK